MTTLYIIGNGFDLYHGLPTCYRQFYTFAKETLDELCEYYSLDFSKDEPWCDFEASLGKYDWKALYTTYDYTDVASEDFKPSEAFGLHDELAEQSDQLVEIIRRCFQEWIESIDISTAKAKLDISKNAYFITFNYTSTLELIYKIDETKILHIHGRADILDDLIFGHGETIEEEQEVDENGDSTRTIFSDAENAAKYPFYALKKPVDDILTTHENFFETIKNMREIIIMGHSLNRIDLPYFKKIAKLNPDSIWKVYLHDATDKDKHMENLIQCGVPQNKISFCSY